MILRATTRDFWANIQEIPDGTLEIYTDGSKIGVRVGCGIFIKGSNTKLSFRLPDHCSVFQAEVMGIQTAAQCLLGGKIFPENLLIYSDSQAAN